MLVGGGCTPEPLDDHDAGVGGSSAGGSYSCGAPIGGGLSWGGSFPTGGRTALGGVSGAGTCGTRSNGNGAPFWATWKMPDPPGAGLPTPASYTDLGDGTVRDDITGLVWQRRVYAPARLWHLARDYCGALTLAGGGWRLPSRVELVSLFDFTVVRDPASLPVDVSTMGSGPVFYVWSSSPGFGSTDASAGYWYVDILSGRDWILRDGGDSANDLVCVRGATDTPVCDYVPVSPGELRDPQTDLIWQEAKSDFPLSWSEAQCYCGSLSLGYRGAAAMKGAARKGMGQNCWKKVAMAAAAKLGMAWVSPTLTHHTTG